MIGIIFADWNMLQIWSELMVSKIEITSTQEHRSVRCNGFISDSFWVYADIAFEMIPIVLETSN